MKLRGLVLALTLMALPSSALADPIVLNSGTWTNTATRVMSDSQEGLEIAPFWSGLSWDCTYCGVGYLINAFGAENVEYLHNGSGGAVGFRFAPEENITMPVFFAGITAWTNGIFGRRADGAFTYDSRTGHVSNSWENGAQYALFRVVGPTETRYYLGIEDILVSYTLNDHDHNDYIATFTQPHASVPEPSSLLLMGCALAGLAGRQLRARRKVRATLAS